MLKFDVFIKHLQTVRLATIVKQCAIRITHIPHTLLASFPDPDIVPQVPIFYIVQ